MKLFLKILLAVLLLLVVSGIGGYFYMKKKFQAPANQLVVSRLPLSGRFVWLAGTADGRAMPHAAMLVPVELPGCPRTCYFQFDTGAPTSLLYGHALAALQDRYPATRALLAMPADTVRNLRFTLSSGQVQARSMRVLGMGARALPADSTTPFIIGTLGSDLIEGRVLVIDFVRGRFTLDQRVPDSLAQRTAFAPLTFDNRRVMLTVKVQGKPEKMIFDSGSSAFSLLTSQDKWQQMAQPGAPTRKATMNAMGRKLTSYTASTAELLELESATVPLGSVTYIEGTALMENLLMRFSGMGGMLGNEAFSNRTIILDVRGGRFGVVTP